jgi:hypothetical protein
MGHETKNGISYIMRNRYPACTMPEGEQGTAQITRFTIKEDDAFIHNIRSELHGNSQMEIPPGTYTRLLVKGGIMMSDTPWELRDMSELAFQAGIGGHGLINGLGLGCAVELCFYQGMEKLTVIELNQDVIDLVGPYLKARHGDSLEIICADALTWQSPKEAHYSVVWHDIWRDVCLDNLPQIKKLNRRYGRKTDWQSYWAKPELAKMKREYLSMMAKAFNYNPRGSKKYDDLVALREKNKAEIGI